LKEYILYSFTSAAPVLSWRSFRRCDI